MTCCAIPSQTVFFFMMSQALANPSTSRGEQQRVELSLTPAQRQALARVQSESRAEANRLREQIERLREQLEAQYRQYRMDTHQVQAIHRQLNQAQSRLLQVHLAAQMRLRAILSAEQFDALQVSLDGEDKERRGPPWRAGGNIPPGLAKKGGVPPGLAKKGGVPPGQAKKKQP